MNSYVIPRMELNQGKIMSGKLSTLALLELKKVTSDVKSGSKVCQSRRHVCHKMSALRCKGEYSSRK